MVDWLTSNDIEAMLERLPNDAFDSELRLFAANCASRVLQFLPEPEFASVLDMSRRFANGTCSKAELQTLVDAAGAHLEPHVDVPTVRDFAGSAVVDASSVHPAVPTKIAASVTCALQAVACSAGDSVLDREYDKAYDAAMIAESKTQCDLLRSYLPTPNT